MAWLNRLIKNFKASREARFSVRSSLMFGEPVLVRASLPGKRWQIQPTVDPQSSLPSYCWTKLRNK